jgi:hypothetical protein
MNKTTLGSRFMKLGFVGLVLTAVIAMRHGESASASPQATSIQQMESGPSCADESAGARFAGPPSLGSCSQLQGGICNMEGHVIPCLPHGFCVCTNRHLDCN